MRIPDETAILALTLLSEGSSVRTVSRVTNLHLVTILKLLLAAGEGCKRMMQDKIQGVRAGVVECDELWGFIGCKEKTKKKKGYTDERGDSYCFVGIDRHSKLVLAWHQGRRTTPDTVAFLDKLAMAVEGQFQIDTDGFASYADAVRLCLADRVAHGEIVKVYAQLQNDEHRYSPAQVVAVTRTARSGKPRQRIGTSRVERKNLTIRLRMKRLARLTPCFSRKWENLNAALALHFAVYNFCTIHRTIRCTPAMEAGVVDSIWTMRDLLEAATRY
jgi:IS1 family transposase